MIKGKFWVFMVLLLFLGIINSIRNNFLVVIVKNTSMYPTLEHGDHVLVLRSFPKKCLKKGHIIILHNEVANPNFIISNNAFNPNLFIKRIIGLEGDTIITEINGDTTIQTEQYNLASDQQKKCYVPSGHVFVKGDFPGGSNDSTSWGPLPYKCIMGLMILKLPSKSKNL